MRTVKNLLIVVVVISISGLSGYFFEPEQPVSAVIAMALLGLLVFNLIIRNSLGFQDYFTSPYNIFTSKVRSQKTFDIPKELMFEKVKEVIEDSAFRLKGSDAQKYELLATTRMTFKSWGENMYISFADREGQTVMNVCSVTFFQMVSWGKNEKNCDDLLREIEESFTI